MKPIRVLFIGNSYTFFNNLPDLLEDLSKGSEGTRPVETEISARGGATLQWHYVAGKAVEKIREGKWDYVVLQEQSLLGAKLLNGKPDINDPMFFQQYVRAFSAEIEKAGATTMLMLTWARKQTPEKQARLNASYFSIAQEVGAVVAPVGIAWNEAHQGKADLDLYTADGSHPAPAGSYLAACVLYATLFDRSPEDLPGKLNGRALVTPSAEVTFEDTPTTLVSLSDTDAAYLQRIAYETVQGMDSLEETYSSVPEEAGLPALPDGSPLTPENLAGKWAGIGEFFYSPARMELQISYQEERWSARCSFSLENNMGALSHSTAAYYTFVTEERLSIYLPSFPGSPVIALNAVLTDGKLVGTFVMGEPISPPYFVGNWRLTREPEKE